MMDALDPSLRVVLLTAAGPELAEPVLRATEAAGHRLVGILEPQDPVAKTPGPIRWAEGIYYRLFRPKASRYLRHFAQRRGIEYLELAKISEHGLKAWVRSLRPDLLVLYNAPLIQEEVYSLARFGGVNLHPSLLPKYRGARPILWMHKDFELEGGVTLHFIDDQPDGGDIIAQDRFPISPGMTEKDVEREAIFHRGIPLLSQVLGELRNGACPRTPQQEASPTVFAKQVNHQTYAEMIKWKKWDVEHVWHFLRCTNHWYAFLDRSGISTSWHDFSIGGYDRQVNIEHPPGTLVTGGKPHFVCKNGRVWIEKRLPAKRIIRESLSRLLG